MNENIKRAIQLMGLKPSVQYQMGADTLDQPIPKLDCSAFLWRCLGSRKFDGHFWRNTNWVWNDIENENTKFDIVHELKDIQSGDVIVYKGSNGRAGHCAVIDKYDGKVIQGYDCSQSRNGITYRDLTFFTKKDYRVGRYKG